MYLLQILVMGWSLYTRQWKSFVLSPVCDAASDIVDRDGVLSVVCVFCPANGAAFNVAVDGWTFSTFLLFIISMSEVGDQTFHILCCMCSRLLSGDTGRRLCVQGPEQCGFWNIPVCLQYGSMLGVDYLLSVKQLSGVFVVRCYLCAWLFVLYALLSLYTIVLYTVLSLYTVVCVQVVVQCAIFIHGCLCCTLCHLCTRLFVVRCVIFVHV